MSAKKGPDARKSSKGPEKQRKQKKKANPIPEGESIDWKNIALLRKFISDRGKIRAARVTGVSMQLQRVIAAAIKNAREMALLPYTSSGR